MKIEFLGTGTSQGVPVIQCSCEVCASTDKKDKRLRTSVSIQQAETSIIIDVGPDFRYQMLRAKTPNISAIFLTHEHNDHVSGMDDVRPFNFMQKESIPVYGQKRVLDNIKAKYHYAFSENKYPGAPGFELVEISHGSRFKIGSLTITAFEVIHGDLPILAYKIDEFVYITDAKIISEESQEIASGADVLVLNALHHKKHWSHLTLEEAIKMATTLQAKKTYFTHISHKMGKHEDISKGLPQNMDFAFDTLKINVGE